MYRFTWCKYNSSALHFNCTIKFIAALCVLSQLWFHVQCIPRSQCIYICIYIYMNRVLTQNHMVNDGVHADNCTVLIRLTKSVLFKGKVFIKNFASFFPPLQGCY